MYIIFALKKINLNFKGFFMKKIVMQGDSITDFGRAREGVNENSNLGTGYANLTAAALLAKYPEKDLKFYNRGISGNRVVDLYARWKTDALNLNPDIITILIGINDIWHERDWQNGVEIDRFEQIYDMMICYSKKMLPNVKFVLLSPFILDCGVIDDFFKENVVIYAAAVKRLAEKYGAAYIDTQAIFGEAIKKAEPAYWAADGVHPTPAGHTLISEALQKELEKLI